MRGTASTDSSGTNQLGFCVACGSPSSHVCLEDLNRCDDCGHVYADVALSADTVSEIYASNYFEGEEYADYVADQRALQRNFESRLRVLKRYLDPNLHRGLLEIGSAYGFFLNIARDTFPFSLGIDVTDVGVAHARDSLKLNVVRGDFLEWEAGANEFQVACLWDTIEHLTRPDLYLEKVSKLLPKGGVVALTTGDIGSLNARIRKRQWRLIHPPTHVQYFTEGSLGQILGRFGFKVIYSRFCGFHRSVENMAYNVLLRRGWDAHYESLRKTGLLNWSLYLNMRDIRYVIGVKE